MTEDTLRDLEQQLTLAERTGDANALTRLLSPDFHGVNMHGERIDKTAFITALTRQDLSFDELSIHDVDIHLFPQHASVIGESRFTVRVGSQSFSARAHFLDIWRLEAGTWVLHASSVTLRKAG